MRNLIKIVILLCLVYTSCKKDKAVDPISEPKTSKPSEYIQGHFIFVNHGDKQLKAINLESYFYRIQVNNTIDHYSNYPNVMSHDSIVHYSDSTKVGGQKRFEVQLLFFRSDTIFKRLNYYSTLKADTIKTTADGIELFRWPQDTVKYIKVSQWP